MAPAVSPGQQRDSSASADWPRYIEHLQRTTRQSIRLLELSNRVLERAASGDLRLPVMRTMHDAAASSAREYSTEWIAACARFLAGLAGAATGQTGAIGTPDRPLAEDPAAWFAATAHEASRCYAAHVNTFLGAVVDGRTGSLTPGPVHMLGAVYALQAELQMGLGSALMQAAERCLDMLAGSEPGAAPTRQIRIDALAGATAETAITVENDGASAAVVRCRLADVRRPDGIGPAFEPRVTFDPDPLVVPPGDASVVRMAIVIDERFDAGAVYAGAIGITGAHGPEQRLPLEIQVGVPHAPSNAGGLS